MHAACMRMSRPRAKVELSANFRALARVSNRPGRACVVYKVYITVVNVLLLGYVG